MNLEAVKEEMKDEISRLTLALNALNSLSATNGRRTAKKTQSVRPVRHMSVAARRRIAAAQKARWAAVRAKKAA